MHNNQFSPRLRRLVAEDLERFRREGAEAEALRRAIIRRFIDALGIDGSKADHAFETQRDSDRFYWPIRRFGSTAITDSAFTRLSGSAFFFFREEISLSHLLPCFLRPFS